MDDAFDALVATAVVLLACAAALVVYASTYTQPQLKVFVDPSSVTQLLGGWESNWTHLVDLRLVQGKQGGTRLTLGSASVPLGFNTTVDGFIRVSYLYLNTTLGFSEVTLGAAPIFSSCASTFIRLNTGELAQVEVCTT